MISVRLSGCQDSQSGVSDRYAVAMADITSNPGSTHQYRFSLPGGEEIETGEFTDDGDADTRARELSKAQDQPVIIHRLRGHVDWEYVTEADARD
jgi:hypothetical protein